MPGFSFKKTIRGIKAAFEKNAGPAAADFDEICQGINEMMAQVEEIRALEIQAGKIGAEFDALRRAACDRETEMLNQITPVIRAGLRQPLEVLSSPLKPRLRKALGGVS